MASAFVKILLLVVICGKFIQADEYHPDRGTHKVKASGRPKRSAGVAEDAAYWNELGQKLLSEELHRQKHQRIDKVAKNIIFFLGDGMSIPTVTAGRIYKGQKAGATGEESDLTFDLFPYVALAKTYCTDVQVADSACTATAYLCGVKTDTDTLGLDANVEFKNCATQNEAANRVDSIMKWAQDADKATGIVTTTRITHATPAGTYAHVANRDWETDYDILKDNEDPATCDDIAEQLVLNEPGNKFKVILGGGRGNFMPNTTRDPETGKGRRQDGKNLINKWIADHASGSYVTTRNELLNLNLSTVDSIFGLFSPGHLEYFTESADANNPTLEEMTRTAIRMLQKDDDGFVLLVEGGRIDHAHHDGMAKMSLEETIQFDLAIQTALDITDRSDTLIIVTADHSHTMTINGYPARGNPLLGVVVQIDGLKLAQDGLPHATLSYANGPGYNSTFRDGKRVNLSSVDMTADRFKQPAGVPLDSETHGGDDVAIYAIGPQAHLFQGVYEQHYIAHVMGYAACMGPGLKFCDQASTISPTTGRNSSGRTSIDLLLLTILSALVTVRFVSNHS